MKKPLHNLLRRYRDGLVTTSEMVEHLSDLPFRDLRFAKVDLHRPLRRRFAEVIYAKGKTPAQVVAIAEALRRAGGPVLATKVTPEMMKAIRPKLPWLSYYPEAGIAAGPVTKKKRRASGPVLVISAGTSDIPVAEEAAVTAECLGEPVKRLFDVGVAGLHRILAQRKLLRSARVIVVVAGMDGALPSVVSGLVGCPVIAVPTSVGYGASFRGVAPLLTMLNSCSPGVAVVNIDNGFGAGYLAALLAATSLRSNSNPSTTRTGKTKGRRRRTRNTDGAVTG